MCLFFFKRNCNTVSQNIIIHKIVFEGSYLEGVINILSKFIRIQNATDGKDDDDLSAKLTILVRNLNKGIRTKGALSKKGEIECKSLKKKSFGAQYEVVDKV